MIVKEQNYLEHYGRKGMHWYQHIFGDVQMQAKYFNKPSEKQYSRYQQKRRRYYDTKDPYSKHYKNIARFETLLNNDNSSDAELDKAEKAYRRSHDAVQKYMKSDKVNQAFDTLISNTHKRLSGIFAPRKEVRAQGISEKEYQRVKKSITNNLSDNQKTSFTVFQYTENGDTYNVLTFGDGTFEIFEKVKR